MKFLLEHQMAFDQEALGFPSIQGCHAIVYQTALGLYGFHVAGNSADDRWQIQAELFARFIRPLAGRHHLNQGYRLYGSSFVGNNQRGYSGDPRAKWAAELTTYATALHFGGRISGYDLHKTLGDGASAYLEYRVNGEKCDLYIRRYDQHAEQPHPTAPNPNPLTHRVRTGGGNNPTLADLANAITFVDRNNLLRVHKQRLR